MTAVACAVDLIRHPDFQSLCLCWERDKRCPLCFPDWLREQGLHEQGRVAEWAVQEPGRRALEESDLKGPTPLSNPHIGHYRWWSFFNAKIEYYYELRVRTDDVDRAMMKIHSTFAGAICALLDHYQPPEGDL